MDKVQKILEKAFHKTGWQVEKPKEGWEKVSFIATLDNEKYFIKLQTNKNIMTRLDELEVAPRIITAGDDWIIQEFIPESFVERQWLADNVQELAPFFLRFHKDKQLTQLLKDSIPKDKLTIKGELDNLQDKLKALPEKHTDVLEAIQEVDTKYENISISLEPAHDDPNYKNIFLHNKRLIMIDWNNIRLSDQLSDIGALLWWYIPENKWKEFFDAYGIELNQSVLERVYLAAAKMSLGFTIWCLENNVDYRLSFTDFQEAIHNRPNPRAWYNG